MTLPMVKFDTGIVDEAALISAIAALATSAGWTVVTGGGVTWFLSSGSLGIARIVGGLAPAGVRQMSAYAAADLDQNNIVSATVKGYVNNDSANTTALGAKVLAPTAFGQWNVRQVGATLTYVAVASLDSIAVIVKYISIGGPIAKGILHIGSPEPAAGRGLQQQTYARIAAIDASVPASTIITLDRNINPGLKDSYLGDPYVCAPMFQSISGPGMPATDFALVQRIPIKAGTLTTFAGSTRFQIDATAAGKLTGAPGGIPGRYRAGRGVGDVMRLFAQPTIVAAGSGSNGIYTQGTVLHTNLASWDAAGGQGATVDVRFQNEDANLATSNHPAQETNRFVTYRIYAIVDSNATTMVPQPDNQGLKNVGALKNMIEASYLTGQITDYAIIQTNARKSQRYRTLGNFDPNGIRGVTASGAGFRALAVGPGW